MEKSKVIITADKNWHFFGITIQTKVQLDDWTVVDGGGRCWIALGLTATDLP